METLNYDKHQEILDNEHLNLLSIFYFIFGAEIVEKEINSIGTESGNLFIALGSLVLVTLLVVSVYREEVKSD